MATFQKVQEQSFIELCADGSYQEIKKVLDSGVDVKSFINAFNEFGSTPLMMAARWNTPDIVKLLIDYGADVKFAAYDGNTALTWASSDSTAEAIEYLIEAGADANATRYDGLTPLMGAASKNTPEAVKILINAGAIVKARNSIGMTAVLYAAMNNPNPEVVNILIEAGADDIPNNNGRNSVMLAAMMNNAEVVDALIKAGAEVHARDVDGKTALYYARENDKLKGTEALRKLEALSREGIM